MTLIVGIVCKDAIVFGAESETSREPAKYQGTHKLHIVPFKNDCAIVGESGVAHLSSMALCAFKKIAANTDVLDEDTIRKTAGLAFREVISEINCPRIGTLKCQEFFRMEVNYFELTIAYYHNGKPHLFVLNPVFGTAASPNRNFSVSGIAGYLAEYLLKDFNFSKLHSHSAVTVAAHVVNEVKTAVMGCGGNTEIVLVSSGKKPEKLTGPFVDLIDERLKMFSKQLGEQRLHSFSSLLESEKMAYQSLLTGGEQESVKDE